MTDIEMALKISQKPVSLNKDLSLIKQKIAAIEDQIQAEILKRSVQKDEADEASLTEKMNELKQQEADLKQELEKCVEQLSTANKER